MWPRRVQNPFCTNIDMRIKSKIMKSRIQWWGGGGGACLGVTRGQKVGFLGLFFGGDCHTIPLKLFELWKNLETVTDNGPMDEDCRNAFGILMSTEICDGAGMVICDSMPSTFPMFLSLKTLCCGTHWNWHGEPNEYQQHFFRRNNEITHTSHLGSRPFHQ